jgi:hypothetical protein
MAGFPESRNRKGQTAMANQHLATISGPRSTPCEQQRRNLLRKWLGLFALNAGQPLDADALSVYVTLWLEGFADLQDDVLEAALKKTLTTCKFWPVKIADVREHVEQAEDSRANGEWPRLLEYINRHVYPDPLEKTNAHQLPADIAHAAAAAGGLLFLESCPTDELQWAKKRFVEDLTRRRKCADLAPLLGDSKLEKLLAEAAPRFSLPSVGPVLLAAPRTPKEISDSQCNGPTESRYGLQRERDPQFATLLEKGGNDSTPRMTDPLRTGENGTA